MTGYKKNRMSTSEKMRKSLNELNHNKIWVTKKIRMNASERMRKKNDLINYILIYFSGCLSVMMVLSLYSSKGIKISLFSSIISMILTSANIFQYKAEYLKKSDQYFSSYSELSKLESRITYFLDSEETEDEQEIIKAFFDEYEDILGSYINHDLFDYNFYNMKRLREDKNEKILKKYFNFFSMKIYFKNFCIFLVCLIPACIIVLKIKEIIV